MGGAAGFGLVNPGSLGTRSTAGAGGGATSPASSPAGGSPPPSVTTPAASQYPNITIPGHAPDYASLIENDPAYQQLKSTLSAQGISDASHLRSAIQQAFIQFGAVPNLPSDVAKNAGLDTAGTAALAQGNPFSVLAQLAQKYNTDQADEKNALAARGILSSGETGYQLGLLGQANALGQYNATNALLGSIGTLNDQYVAGRNAAAQELARGASTAEANQVGMNPAGTGSAIATYDPNSRTWVDPSGQHYTGKQNPDGTWTGTPVSAPAGGWPTAPTGTAPTPPAGTTTTDPGTGTPTPPAAAPPTTSYAQGGWAPGVTPPTLYQPGQIVRGAGIVGD